MIAAMGVDFGTTNSTICLYDGTEYRFVELEDAKTTIPSLMYVNRQYYPTYGESARSQFLKDNHNRQIKLEKTDLGYIEIALGDGAYESFDHTGFAPGATTYDAKVTAFTDQQLPGILFASTKRLLGNALISSIKTFEKSMKLEAIVSSIIQNIKEKTFKSYPNTEIPHICVGRPVNYECSAVSRQAECNSRAIERMNKALEYADIHTSSYFLEPIAPVLSYMHDHREEINQTVLVSDFGGGTLDFSILTKHGSQLNVVGNEGYALGGDIITERLIRDFIFPRLGITDDNLTALKRSHNYLEEMVPDILNWRTTYILNQPKFFMRIADAIKLLPQEAENLNRIRLLIIQNYSYNVFYAVENAKKRLSDMPETEIDLDPIGIRFTLTRTDLESSMQSYLSSVEQSIRSFCENNAYSLKRIGRVLLTGGTSLIPCIKQRIELLFGGKVVSVDPFLSIVKGFALGAWLQSHDRIALTDDHIRIDME